MRLHLWLCAVAVAAAYDPLGDVLGLHVPGIDTSLVDEAEGEARQGAAANARLLKTEEAKMDAGNEQLMAWNQQQLNKYDGNKIIQDPKGYIHQENVKQEKAATFSDKDFLDKLDKLTSVYRADGTKVDGNLDHDNIVPKSILPDTVENFEIDESYPLDAVQQQHKVAVTKLSDDFKARLSKVLVSKYHTTAAHAAKVVQKAEKLGEAAASQKKHWILKAHEQRRRPTLEQLQAAAMQKAIEILEVDMQKVRLDAEDEPDLSKIPKTFHEVARQLMKPAELKRYLATAAKTEAEAKAVRMRQATAIRKVVESHLMGSDADKKALEGTLDKMLKKYETAPTE